MTKQRTLIVTALMALAAVGSTQHKLPGGRIVPGPSAAAGPVYKSAPAITTSIDDATSEVKNKDDFKPECGKISTLKKGPNGGFILQAGGWSGAVQSYSLHPGAFGPAAGDGFLDAPVKGPLEKAVEHVVQRSTEHTDIPQKYVQVLLWAMVSHTRFNDLSDDLKQAGSLLLSPQEINQMNTGALAVVPDGQMATLFGWEPPIVMQIDEAEATLRGMFTMQRGGYDDMERVAVPSGAHRPGPGSRTVPSGRWSFHPDGYFIRYIPTSYSTTKLEIFVPDGSKCIGKEFDPALHIAASSDTAGQKLIPSARLQDKS